MNIKFNPGNSLAIILIIASLVLLGSCEERTAVLVKDSNTSIDLERTGLDGEYDPSGLAKRVAKALEEDFILNGISKIYVAQNNRKIILKGTISDRNFLDRLVSTAKNVRGVSEVDISQVEVR